MVSRSALRGRLLPVGVPSVEDLLYDLIDACAGGRFFLGTDLRAMTRTSLVSRSHMMISERVVSLPSRLRRRRSASVGPCPVLVRGCFDAAPFSAPYRTPVAPDTIESHPYLAGVLVFPLVNAHPRPVLKHRQVSVRVRPGAPVNREIGVVVLPASSLTSYQRDTGRCDRP